MNRSQMVCHIVFGIIVGLFGLWFFWFETAYELYVELGSIYFQSHDQWIRLFPMLCVAVMRFSLGAIIFLWMVFGCIIASIQSYQQAIQEAIAREETRKMLEQLHEEQKKSLEQLLDDETIKKARENGWLW